MHARFAPALLAATLAFTFAACGDDDEPTDSPSGTGGGGGEPGSAGESSGAGNENSGGDGSEDEIELDAGESVRATIGPDGGALELSSGEFRLEVPEGALEEDVEITLTPVLFDGALFAIELSPSGLSFAEPAVGRVPFPETGVEGDVIAPILFDDEGVPEAAPNAALELDEESGTSSARFDVPHFSYLQVWHRWASSDLHAAFDVEFLAREAPWEIGEGVVVAAPTSFSQTSATVRTQLCTADPDNRTPSTCLPIGVQGRVLEAKVGYWSLQIAQPVRRQSNFIGEFLPVAPAKPAVVSVLFGCESEGEGRVGLSPAVSANVSLVVPNVKYVRRADTYIVKSSPGDTFELEVSMSILLEMKKYDPVHCTKDPSIIGSLGLAAAELRELADRNKVAWLGECTEHSTKSECLPPEPATTFGNTLDPLLEVGPNAAARLDTAFACGESEAGLTLCGSTAPLAAGDWVLISATTLEDLVLEDPVSSYQFAFVFDADGDTSNNYEASAEYPGDFFADTDKWYEALYEPDVGWSLKVRDVRQGLAEVPSEARFMLWGSEAALLVPRAELDGEEPGFRVTAFRHEGDYGLDGGPWSGSYFPHLGERLLDAAGGPTVVLPE